ncbi:MAG: NUDIX domain-containing protein [Candidatus Rokubacteria bacterium]|nr:NUDIX domain-containing protein [Candidatus Rokubacteria bacterium]
MTPVEPKPASSVVLIQPAREPLVSGEPLEIYLVRRNAKMRFLGGYYAFPGGKLEPADLAPGSLARCNGLSAPAAERLLGSTEGIPALAFWVAAIRELFEETGVLMAADADGGPLDLGDPAVAVRLERCRELVIAGRPLAEILAAQGWFLDLRPLRYLSHFITPSSSPIRFSARFFLALLPRGQEPRLFLEETSEGFWIGPREGYRRFAAGEMAMAEPAEYTLGYLAQFDSCAAVWDNHADGRPRFHGILDRIEFYGEGYDWATATWKSDKPPWRV